jgi:hypothetical protein
MLLIDWVKGLRTGVRFLAEAKHFVFYIASRQALQYTRCPVHYVTRGYNGWSVKLTTHLQVVPRLRMTEG